MHSGKNRFVFYFLISSGIILRIFEFVVGRSLWEDEAKLALNIIERGYLDLMQPLRFFQVAPLPFLWTERFFFTIIPSPDYALRIFPLLCGIGMLYPLWYLVRKATKSEALALWTLAFAAFNPFSVYYAVEIKQYSSDLFLAILLPALYFKATELPSEKRKWLLILTAIPAMFFSYVSIFILFTLGSHRLWNWKINKKLEPEYFWIFGAWILLFGINYFLFIHGHSSRDFILDALGEHFMPLQFWTFDFIKWLAFHIGWIFTKTLFFPKIAGIWLLFFCLYLLGIGKWMVEKNIGVLILCLLPVSLHLMMSGLEMYPVVPRLMYYLLPFFLIPISAGLNAVMLFLRKYNGSAPVLQVSISIVFLWWLWQVPVYNEELKPALKYMEQNIQRDDQVYLYYGAVNTFEYYQKTGFVSVQTKITAGSINRENPEKYLDEIQTLRPPLWLVFQHVYPFDSSPNEEEQILEFVGGKYEITHNSLHQKASVYRLKERN